MPQHHSLNYIEMPSQNLPATQAFFEQVFQWEFESYGPAYIAFKEAQLDGGFFQSDKNAHSTEGAPLVIFYSEDLEASLAAVEQAQGKILRPIFSFPGGRRFHFQEPGGNELAIWGQ